MKSHLSAIIALAASLFCSGCVCTEKVANKSVDHPAYALLLPLALPADLIVSPAVGIYYVWEMSGPQGDGAGSP